MDLQEVYKQLKIKKGGIMGIYFGISEAKEKKETTIKIIRVNKNISGHEIIIGFSNDRFNSVLFENMDNQQSVSNKLRLLADIIEDDYKYSK